MKALIVDDEARVRKAIRLLVDWEAHGITQIDEAHSGSSAIEKIRQDKPGLVIIDMMMHEGSGLDLMTWLSEFSSSVQFIVVSGHDDFDFVRQTVRHGGIDYILKPIDPEAINIAVAKAVAVWRDEESDRQIQHKQSIQLNEWRPVYGEKLLSSLIDDPRSAEGSVKKLREEHAIPLHVTKARLLLLQLDASDLPLLKRFGNNGDLLHFTLINICNEFLNAQQRGIAFQYWGTPGEIILLLWQPQEDVLALVTQINQGLFTTLQRRMHFGIGTAGAFPSSLPAQYEEARSAIMSRNLLHSGHYAHIASSQVQVANDAKETDIAANTWVDQELKGKPLAFADFQEEWRISVLSGSPSQIAAAASYWIDQIHSRGRITSRQLLLLKADMLLFRSRLLREALGEDADAVIAKLELTDAEFPAPYETGYSFSLFAWRDWSEKFLLLVAETLSSCQGKESHVFADILKYVQQHYTRELVLQDIAAAFFVSREYVSRRFKQEFGIHFSDYLSSYRIDKAKQLMINPHLKVSQIAEMVGFRDVKYFSKVFKKQTGLSPKEFRNGLVTDL